MISYKLIRDVGFGFLFIVLGGVFLLSARNTGSIIGSVEQILQNEAPMHKRILNAEQLLSEVRENLLHIAQANKVYPEDVIMAAEGIRQILRKQEDASHEKDAELMKSFMLYHSALMAYFEEEANEGVGTALADIGETIDREEAVFYGLLEEVIFQEGDSERGAALCNAHGLLSDAREALRNYMTQKRVTVWDVAAPVARVAEEAELLSEVLDHEERILANKLMSALMRLKSAVVQYVEEDRSTQGGTSADDMRDTALLLSDECRNILNRLQVEVQTHIDSTQKEMIQSSQNLQTINLAASGFAIILLILVGTFMGRAISTPARLLMDGAVRFAKGELNSRIKLKTGDEFERLALILNEMAFNIKRTTTSVDELNAEVINRRAAEEKLRQEIEKSEANRLKAVSALKELQRAQIANTSMMENLLMAKEEVESRGAELEESRAALMSILKDVQEEREKAVAIQGEAVLASQTKSRFLANMSHEIRTPMNAVLGFLELLQDSELDEKQRDYVRTSLTSGRILLDIINDILDISKVEAGELKLESIDFDLSHLIEDLVRLLEPRVTGKGLKLRYTIADDVPYRVEGDPTRLRQIIINLVGNAVKFTEQGIIALQVSMREQTGDDCLLHISVRDTGAGIAGERLESIFEAFAQEDASTTRKYGGTGLGLSICKAYVSAMGGEISVKSEVGRGSEFSFTIRVREKKRLTSDEIAPLRGRVLKGMKAVVSSNDPETRLFLRTVCEGVGLSVTEGASGVEVMQRLKASKKAGEGMADLLLVDTIGTTTQDGTTAVALRESTGEEVKIIAVSSDVRPGAAGEAREGGFDGFLPKPAGAKELVTVIAAVLGDKRKEGSIVTKHLATENSLNGVRVLVAEDNPVNQKLVEIMLKQMGCLVEIVSNGEEAVAKVAEKNCDVVLMDLMMPVMGGIEATKAIRKSVDQKVPIIALTAAAMKEDEDRVKAAGMNDFCTKPIDLNKLKEKLQTWSHRG